MPEFLKRYVCFVEAISRRVGRAAMYLIFVLMAILIYSSVSKALGDIVLLPAQWTLEMAQFVMVAYYILGGPYSMQQGEHVRMDLVYANWSPRTKAIVDCLTVGFLLFYLGVLLYGGVVSTTYAIEYNERSYSAWAPYMAPIKIIMCIGVVLMILQTTAVMLKDFARARGLES
ncbi:MAG: TRAP transporter small permease subunit [Rhodospirillales bacterium]|nr:TRAP transporter small permease subunit [Rhodospirillales bacterium]